MKRLLATTAVIGLAVAGIGTASAQPDLDKVTGGGQIIVDTSRSPAVGPGDTIAFNARNTSDADDTAQGQLQYVGREGAGRPTDKFHGEVTCLQVSGKVARIGGVITNGAPGFFRIDLVDNGQGNSEDDTIKLSRDDEAFTCDMSEEDDDNQMQLGRGNVQVHDAE